MCDGLECWDRVVYLPRVCNQATDRWDCSYHLADRWTMSSMGCCCLHATCTTQPCLCYCLHSCHTATHHSHASQLLNCISIVCCPQQTSIAIRRYRSASHLIHCCVFT